MLKAYKTLWSIITYQPVSWTRRLIEIHGLGSEPIRPKFIKANTTSFHVMTLSLFCEQTKLLRKEWCTCNEELKDISILDISWTCCCGKIVYKNKVGNESSTLAWVSWLQPIVRDSVTAERLTSWQPASREVECLPWLPLFSSCILCGPQLGDGASTQRPG